ncbi:MAG: MFS transporter [Alteromonas sp.]|uniref:MFS transporter n=1 Tax=Alteromonas sp. TaxID=232 RepID=UPI000B6DCE86|nr:MFS transporter [Alteromonas sp.]MAI37983.1 MFS transporter [Alteromonas sp.]OUX86871.1 MAG: MFS transporter [Alteromonas sp. TMED35]|tara:strand:+ start:32716 stop:33933 length:1218 start_codon:yes stop_codon:yes gene_type:complete
MFMMFAMTSDSVGEIIKEVKVAFSVTNAQASLMHSLPMLGIALSGLFLGFLADKIGRKPTIIMGLAIFGVACYSFLVADDFLLIVSLMSLSGVAVGVFKTGALALIGDISSSTKQHTSTMNGAEAFFGVGAIIGPLIVAYLIHQGVAWQWLYVIAGGVCTVLILGALFVKYPNYTREKSEKVKQVSVLQSLALVKNPYAFGFSVGAFLYVAAESAIYVWMPSYLVCDASTLRATYDCYTEGVSQILAIYSVTAFFILRAAGRFVGIWMMSHFNWALVLMLFSGGIVLCFGAGLMGGKQVALYLFPLTGIFMSVIYPTFNSKGISCFPKHQHGSVAGVILFFTAAGAAAGPFIMGLVSDANGGDAKYGFMVATVFAAILFIGMVYNFVKNPTQKRLAEIEASEYSN